MNVTKKLTMTIEDKNEIINGLNRLTEYSNCYEDIFGCNFDEAYNLSCADEILSAFIDSLDSTYIECVEKMK